MFTARLSGHSIMAICVVMFSMVPKCSMSIRYMQPENCTWEPLSDTAGVSMICKVRTLQNGATVTNFSLITPGQTVHLTIYCEDLLFLSEIGSNSLEHLRGLKRLRIERCKLDRLPPNTFKGLSGLEQLTVRSYNTKWGRFSLKVPSSTLAPLTSVESVDFSENNIEILPPGLFCGHRQLEFVNLTNNGFSEVANIGFASASLCTPTVRTVDLAYNKINVLPELGFSTLGVLQELRLSHNQIVRMEPFALAGLVKLERLDLAHNILLALPAALFQSTPKLSELYLRNNSLSALPPGLFSGLNKLTVLDLGHNQLSALEWLGALDNRITESHLPELSVVDLSFNRLTRLYPNAFHSLISLQVLQLQNNLIESIADNTFAPLDNLQTLTLSNNRLKSIGRHTMAGLSVVMTLQLDNNWLEAIHADAFKNVSMLQELNLAGNMLTTVPRAVASLHKLRSLDLSDNDIGNVGNASYEGLNQLHALNLMGNKIGNITLGTFDNLPSVRVLNLARNDIQSIEHEAFDDMPGLHYLRLDSNLIEDINGLFSNLQDLIMLNVSVNRIRWFDYAIIPIGLQWLDIHDNMIEVLGNFFELEQNLKLRTLDASFNKLTELDSSSLPNGIEIVFLRNNNLKRIQPFTFLGKQNLTRVDLTNNHLEILEITTFRLSEVPSRRPLPEFAITNNPYLCDCHMEWLQHLQNLDEMSSEDSRHYPRIIDLYDVQCRLSFTKVDASQTLPVLKVKPSQFLCEYKSHCFSLCHCCDFDACDCEMVCSNNCICLHDQSWSTNIVECSGRNHSDSPKLLPMDVSEVYLDGNNIPFLTPHSFIGRKSMEVLVLNNSNIVTIQNSTFSGLPRLRVLRLDYNKIATLHGREFDGLSSLRELYLSNNKLKHLSNITFFHLRSLQVLHLNQNLLVEISVWAFQHNPALTDLRLAGNPWSCNCYFMQDLAKFIQESGNGVQDISQISCLFNETTVLPLWELNMTECHSPSQATSLVRHFHLRRIDNILPMIIVLGALLVLFGALLIAVVMYRHKMSVWFFSHYGVRIFQRAHHIQEEKLFDAFVSYSKKDEAFVAQVLAPELECGTPAYRLCLHYRDLSMVGGYLSEAVQEAVECSRRTIVILSENFLKSEWCRYEFKSAHSEVLNSNHKLVVIFVGRVSFRELDPDIRRWIKHSTFLHWGEKNFWDKLRYAMPAEARHRKPTGTMRSDVASVAVHI